ncbi:hypothetical protein T4B_161 [Trichinella pseudospiralis]|uniref:Uncharacterized protein n=2 Tax=Trichinella pseudospiralis TaxID=6337 RepID=A0A0V1IES0_TRIPS|nr:hypothetical protein T4D_4636 [Trichinella pseudospiralis]KRZ20983.1 hypothetical protein T4B_161 [Trichinella pseudospiralis]KRZ28018.1 hypothetical protein T4C_9744 [Trichinella pseudospiralis]
MRQVGDNCATRMDRKSSEFFIRQHSTRLILHPPTSATTIAQADQYLTAVEHKQMAAEWHVSPNQQAN